MTEMRRSRTGRANVSRGAGSAFGGLVGLPGGGLFRHVARRRMAEDVRMAADHLVGDPARDVVEIELTRFLGHAGMEDHLQEEIAELVLERLGLAALGRLGDLVGFLDGVGRDGGEALLEVPGTAVLGVAQTRHDVDETGEV